MRKSPTIKYICWLCTFVLISFVIITPTGFRASSQDPFTPTPNANSGTQVIEADSSTVVREGSWASQSVSSASGGSYLYSSGSEQDILTLSFSGTTIEVLYVAGPNLGTLALEVDGTVLRTVITTADQTVYHQSASVNYLTNELHTLHVYAQEGGIVAVDAFITIVPPVDEPQDTLSAVTRVEVPPDDPAYQITYQTNSMDVALIYTSTTPHQLTIGGERAFPSLSPTGTMIVYRSGSSSFGMLERNSQGQWFDRGIFSTAIGISIIDNLSWSPDGTKILFAAYNNGFQNAKSLFYMDLTKCTVVNNYPTLCLIVSITQPISYIVDANPSWSPDGTRIVFDTNRGGEAKRHLYTIRPNGSDLSRINYSGFAGGELPGVDFLVSPEWSPDGTRLIVNRRGSTSNWWRVSLINPDGSNLIDLPITRLIGYDAGYSWSPDSNYVVFNDVPTSGTPPYHMYVLSLATQQLTDLGEGYYPNWRRQVIPGWCVVNVNQGMSVTGYQSPVDARTERFEATPAVSGDYNRVFGQGSGLLLNYFYDRGNEQLIYYVAQYRISPNDPMVIDRDPQNNIPRGYWINTNGRRFLDANLPVGVLDFDRGNAQNTSVTDCTQVQATQLVQGIRPVGMYRSQEEQYIEDIRDYGVDVRRCGNEAWTSTELFQLRQGLIQTAEALRLAGVTGVNNFERFKRVLISDNTTNGITADVPDFLLFIKLQQFSSVPNPCPNDTITGTPQFAYDESSWNWTPGNSECKANPGDNVSNNPQVYHFQARPATIGCRFGPQTFAFTQYTAVHELGHIFDIRAKNSQFDSNGIAIGYLRSRLEYFGSYTNNNNTTNRMTTHNTTYGPAGSNLSMVDCNQKIILGLSPNWTRGDKGWGTIKASNGAANTNFQQNPSNTAEETAADMFLNWVYRRITDPTAVDGDNPAQACSTQLVAGSWEGFRNIDGQGRVDPSTGNLIVDTGYPGNRRYWWMEREMRDILTQLHWRP